MRSQDFAKINPQMKVPAITDTQNNLSMGQSHAIMRYLCEKYQLDEQWYPRKDLKRQAKINEYLDMHHTSTRKCSYLIFNTLFGPKVGIIDPTFKEDYAKKLVHSALKYIDTKILQSSYYLAGNVPSIADLAAFYQIEFLILINYDYSKYPKLQAWMQRMKQIKQVNEANSKFYKIAHKMAGNDLKPKL